MESINDYQEREPRRQTAFGRWGQTVLGHFPFHAGIALLQSLSFLPGAACIYLYGRLGGALLLAAGWLLLGLTGPVYAAMQKMTWQEQFDFPCYLYREFFQEVKKNFRQGYCMGLLFTALWGLVLAPLVIAEMSEISLPVWAVIVMLAAACLLLLMSAYGFYQMGRWQLSVGAMVKNALLLVFALGLRSFAVLLLWAGYLVLFALFPPYVLPVNLILGIPALLTVTAQAIYVPRIDKMMGMARDMEKKED